MTLEDVSGATKVSVRNLRALEQEKFDQMPGGIFNRGFVRAYAKHLGLDDDQVVADYQEAAGESAPQSDTPETTESGLQAPADSKEESAGKPGEEPGQVPWAALVGLLILGTLLLAIWSYRSHRKGSIAAPEGAQPTSQAQPAPSQGGPAQSAVSAPDMQAGSAPAAPSPGPAIAVTNLVDSGSSDLGSATQVPPGQKAATLPDKSEPDKSSSEKAGFDLSLRALDEVWLSTAVDGRPPSESTMEEGQSMTVHAAERAIIRVGNARAIQVSFNGQKVPVRGADGEVRTLTFTATGLQEPPAAPTSAKHN